MSQHIFPTARARRGKQCEHCGQPIEPGRLQAALVPDPSAADFAEFALYGQRLVYACGDEHMSEIVDRARRGRTDTQ